MRGYWENSGGGSSSPNSFEDAIKMAPLYIYESYGLPVFSQDVETGEIDFSEYTNVFENENGSVLTKHLTLKKVTLGRQGVITSLSSVTGVNGIKTNIVNGNRYTDAQWKRVSVPNVGVCIVLLKTSKNIMNLSDALVFQDLYDKAKNVNFFDIPVYNDKIDSFFISGGSNVTNKQNRKYVGYSSGGDKTDNFFFGFRPYFSKNAQDGSPYDLGNFDLELPLDVKGVLVPGVLRSNVSCKINSYIEEETKRKIDTTYVKLQGTKTINYTIPYIFPLSPMCPTYAGMFGQCSFGDLYWALLRTTDIVLNRNTLNAKGSKYLGFYGMENEFERATMCWPNVNNERAYFGDGTGALDSAVVDVFNTNGVGLKTTDIRRYIYMATENIGMVILTYIKNEKDAIYDSLSSGRVRFYLREVPEDE